MIKNENKKVAEIKSVVDTKRKDKMNKILNSIEVLKEFYLEKSNKTQNIEIKEDLKSINKILIISHTEDYAYYIKEEINSMFESYLEPEETEKKYNNIEIISLTENIEHIYKEWEEKESYSSKYKKSQPESTFYHRYQNINEYNNKFKLLFPKNKKYEDFPLINEISYDYSKIKLSPEYLESFDLVIFTKVFHDNYFKIHMDNLISEKLDSKWDIKDSKWDKERKILEFAKQRTKSYPTILNPITKFILINDCFEKKLEFKIF